MLSSCFFFWTPSHEARFHGSCLIQFFPSKKKQKNKYEPCSFQCVLFQTRVYIYIYIFWCTYINIVIITMIIIYIYIVNICIFLYLFLFDTKPSKPGDGNPRARVHGPPQPSADPPGWRRSRRTGHVVGIRSANASPGIFVTKPINICVDIYIYRNGMKRNCYIFVGSFHIVLQRETEI